MGSLVHPTPEPSATTTSERVFSFAFEGGIGTDIFDAFIATVSWGDALALRGTCKQIKQAVDRRFGPDLCSRVDYWNSPVVVARRQEADKLVACMTPYSDCWSALSDPLFAPWIVNCLDDSESGGLTKRMYREKHGYDMLRSEFCNTSTLCRALETLEPSISRLVIREWGRTKRNIRYPSTGYTWRNSHIFSWTEEQVKQLKRKPKDSVINHTRKFNRNCYNRL